MNSSRNDHPANGLAASTGKSRQSFSGDFQHSATTEKTGGAFAGQADLFGPDRPAPGSMDDAAMIRGILTQAIRECGKSRAQIADEMSELCGRKITERQLNGFTAESREDFRWPAELDRAFCYVTADDRLLRTRAELAGYKVITSDEARLLELGKQYLLQKEAAAQIARLEIELHGRTL